VEEERQRPVIHTQRGRRTSAASNTYTTWKKNVSDMQYIHNVEEERQRHVIHTQHGRTSAACNTYTT
jgi:hypothetical protein